MRGTVDGLVLREVSVGESDKLLTVLTAPYGKITVMAKGARSMRSKLSPLCHLFSYGNLEFYEKNGKRWLSGGSVNEGFYALHSDMEGYALGAYLLELADRISGEGVDATDLLRMTLNALHLTAQQKKPRELIRGVYQVFAAVTSGFMPELSACERCDAVAADRFYLDVMDGSIRCPSCFAAGGGAHLPLHTEEAASTRRVILPVTETVCAAWRYVATAPLSRIFSFEITDEEELAAFARVGQIYLQHHLECGFDSLTFYEAIKETPKGVEKKDNV